MTKLKALVLFVCGVLVGGIFFPVAIFVLGAVSYKSVMDTPTPAPLPPTPAPVFSVAKKDETVSTSNTQIYFSPKGGCQTAILSELHKAKKKILIQAYSFTSKPIVQELLDAKSRGVEVEIITDKSSVDNASRKSLYTVSVNGCAVYVDAKHAIAHNKVMIIDDIITITGSFNFSAAAESSNAENLLVIKSKLLAESYTKNWETHKEHSTHYIPTNE